MNRARQSVVDWSEDVGQSVTILNPWCPLSAETEARIHLSADTLLRDRWRIIAQHPNASPRQLDDLIAEKMGRRHS
jgi:hypothetical protein